MHSYELHVHRQYRWPHCLRHHVRTHRLCPHIEKLDESLTHSLSNEVPLRQNVLAPPIVRMLDVIEIGKQTHKALDGKW